MKKINLLMLLISLVLMGCSEKEEVATANETVNEENASQEDGAEDEVGAGPFDEDYVEVDLFNGFNPRDQLEADYFTMIGNMWYWNSFVSEFNYTPFIRSSEGEMGNEIYSLSRYVLEPFQLYQDYQSIYFSNDIHELYVTEDYGYISNQMEPWEPLEYYEEYVKSPVESRLDLLFNMILNSNGIVEYSADEIYVDINEENFESIYNHIQLALFHNLTYRSDEYLELEGVVTETLEELEGIMLQLYVDGEKLTGYEILISYNRTDEETVDQILISEHFSEINEFDSIETPTEIVGD